MSTELGKAYVQIMPSAKGISGSIQKTLNPEATSAGKSAGSRIASSIASSMGSAGKTLTKSITVPAMAAATAVSGVVAALGWKRLVAVDAAQAQLKGLGYSAEDVSRISEGLREAITGGMLTMAEATSAAATAMAAGVKEGDELTRYIKLLDSAVVGGTGSFGEMEQIFGRVVDQGKLTRTEFDMIAQRMPGFSAAVQSHMGVGSEAMYEMLRNGEITTDDFLDVMENFAGGMADAYADSWSGMVQNTLANVGIIGETILGGVFEQSKESIAEFLDFLRSDDLKTWAAETGQAIGQTFSSIVESVKSVIQWWTNLDGSTQKLLLTIGGIAVAIGPVLMIISKLITGVMAVHRWIGLLKVGFEIVSTAIGAISWPVVAVVAAIAGLIAIFVALYNENERFREIVGLVWEEIKNVIQTVVGAVSDFVMGIVGGLVDWWQENNELILESARVVWEAIKETIMAVLEFMLPMIQTAWEGIKNNIAAAWDLITTIVQTGINFVKGIIKAVMQMITGDWSGAWETIKSTVSGLITGIKDIISKQINLALTIIRGVLDNIKAKFSAIFNPLKNIVGTAFTAVKNSIKRGMDTAYNTVTRFFGKFKDAGKNIVTSIADGIKGAISKVTDAISNVTQKVRDFLPFSPPKTGPLMDIMDVEWGATIGAGIENGEDEVAKAMDNMLNFDLTKKAKFNDPQNNNRNNNRDDLSSQQNQPIILQVDGKTFAQIIGDYTSAEGGNRIRRIERGLA